MSVIERMSANDFINQSKEVLVLLEEQQEFEMCLQLKLLIQSIENLDVLLYYKINFVGCDLPFLKGKRKMLDRVEAIKNFLGLDSIFQYSFNRGYECPYYRYAHGIKDVFHQVEF